MRRRAPKRPSASTRAARRRPHRRRRHRAPCRAVRRRMHPRRLRRSPKIAPQHAAAADRPGGRDRRRRRPRARGAAPGLPGRPRAPTEAGRMPPRPGRNPEARGRRWRDDRGWRSCHPRGPRPGTRAHPARRRAWRASVRSVPTRRLYPCLSLLRGGWMPAGGGLRELGRDHRRNDRRNGHRVPLVRHLGVRKELDGARRTGHGRGPAAGSALRAHRARGTRRSHRALVVHKPDRLDDGFGRCAHRPVRGAWLHRDGDVLRGPLRRSARTSIRHQRRLSGVPGRRDGSDHRIPRRDVTDWRASARETNPAAAVFTAEATRARGRRSSAVKGTQERLLGIALGMLRPAWGWPERYGIAVVVTVLVAALKLSVPAFGAQGPDLFLTIPVAASAVFGGFGPALLATIGATILAAYFTPPAGLTIQWNASGLDVLGFFFEGVIVAVLGAAARAAFGRTLESLRRSEELERERSALIETVNHELRNPLASLSGHVQLASRYAARDDRRDRVPAALEQAQEHIARLIRLTDDLLVLSRSIDAFK